MSDIMPERGEISWVDFEPAVGSEPSKVRPAVVVSIAELDRLRTRIVVPLTSWQPRHERQPNKVRVSRSDTNQLADDSAADGAHVRTVALSRFVERLGTIEANLLQRIADSVGVAVGARYEA